MSFRHIYFPIYSMNIVCMLHTLTLYHWSIFFLFCHEEVDTLSEWIEEIGLGCVTPLSTIFQFYLEDSVLLEETRVSPQITDKLYHIKLYRVLNV